MSNIYETILRLDDENNMTELSEFVRSFDSGTKSSIMRKLMRMKRIRPACVLAMYLSNAGFRDAYVSLVLSAGDLVYNLQSEKYRGVDTLRSTVDAMTIEQRMHFYNEIVMHTIEYLAAKYLHDPVKMPQVLEILKAAVPLYRTIFDFNTPAPHILSVEEMRQRGREQARLISYRLPPADVPRQRRRVVIGSTQTTGRPANESWRWTAALNAYGWDAILCPVANGYDQVDCRAIIDTCRHHDAEILIVELFFLASLAAVFSYKTEDVIQQFSGKSQALCDVLDSLRQGNPSFKCVGTVGDAWLVSEAVLTKKLVDRLDVVLPTDAPFLPFWDSPFLSRKVLMIPPPTPSLGPAYKDADYQETSLEAGISEQRIAWPPAEHYGLPNNRPLTPRMLFSASVSLVTLDRAFWMMAAKNLNLPIQEVWSRNVDDGLSPLDSYALYMKRLAEATCCLNFNRRFVWLADTIVGRAFEIPLSGSLLIQETSPSMQACFIAGEHYLEFSSISELVSIAHFITERPEEAEEIRQRGYAFARDRYSSEKLAGYLDYQLYFVDRETEQ